MKADLSRITFQKEKHYQDVIRQQGRVDVDANWNEQQAINVHRIETEARDVIGPSGAPVHNSGFHIVKSTNDLTAEEQRLPGNQITPPTPAAGDFLIGAGRHYVDGILCENEQPVLFSAQPDLPGQPQNLPDLLQQAGASIGIVDLDVWLRHVTALDDDLIREKALGGPDTATRSKVVSQVKILPWKIPPAPAAPTGLQILASSIAQPAAGLRVMETTPVAVTPAASGTLASTPLLERSAILAPVAAPIMTVSPSAIPSSAGIAPPAPVSAGSIPVAVAGAPVAVTGAPVDVRRTPSFGPRSA